MITQYFLDLPYYALSGIINFFPLSQGFPPQALQAANAIGSKIGIFGPVMPLDTLSLCLGILFSAQLGIWGFKTIKWIMSHVPFIGGRG